MEAGSTPAPQIQPEPREWQPRVLWASGRLLCGVAAFFFVSFVFAYFYLRSLDVNTSWKVGEVKTEASRKPIPIDPYVAEDLLAWYHTTKYVRPDHYVFATDAARAGKKRGEQPLWLAKVMQYHIQPAAKEGGDT